jgi:hypothetical protein
MVEVPLRKSVFIYTANGRAYYNFATLLKRLGIDHTDIVPCLLDSTPSLLLTTRDELPTNYSGVYLLCEELTGDQDIDALTLLSRLYPERADNLTVGVDPGGVTGVAVVYRGNVAFKTFADIHPVISFVRRILEFHASTKTVRVGTGDRRFVEIASGLGGIEGVDLELVDEAGTTRKGGPAEGGQRDAVAALRIARRRGKPSPRRELF